MPDDVEQLRAQLLQLRKRRECLDEDREELAADIKAALGRISGKITMSEAARILGFDRAGLYRTYA